MSNILIVGATGQIGRAVLRELRAAQHSINVLAAVRTWERGEALRSQDIETRVLNLENADTIGPALVNVERALLLTPYTSDMLRQSKRFLDAAATAGVKHIVHIGASGASTNEVAHWGWHQYIERYIEALGFSWAHLRPEAFMQNLSSFGWLGRGTITSYIGDARWSWVDCVDVARVTAAALLDPERHSGKTYRLGVQAASFKDIAGFLTEALNITVRVESDSRRRCHL